MLTVNYEDMRCSEALDIMKLWRDGNERRSEEIMELWDEMLSKNLDKLGSDKHILLEQVIQAALDCHQFEVATTCLMMLSSDFPGSLRIMKLKATIFEAKEKYDEALSLLDTIIKTDETNTGARKRRVAILKAQGLIQDAIKELVDYLKRFMCDVEAWQELCSLYLQQLDYSRAVYCAEELLVHQPHNHLHHQRLADIRYTMGGLENMELAKTYYCHALKLNPDNMRALLGLSLATNNLLNLYKSSGNQPRRKEAFRLNQWAQAHAAKRTPTTGTGTATIPSLDQLMLSLAISE